MCVCVYVCIYIYTYTHTYVLQLVLQNNILSVSYGVQAIPGRPNTRNVACSHFDMYEFSLSVLWNTTANILVKYWKYFGPSIRACLGLSLNICNLGTWMSYLFSVGIPISREQELIVYNNDKCKYFTYCFLMHNYHNCISAAGNVMVKKFRFSVFKCLQKLRSKTIKGCC